MNLLLNVLWVIFGGLWMAVGWLLAAVIMAITIIGIPWARAAFNIARYAFLPFGFAAVDREDHLGEGDIGTGPLGAVGNIVWLVLAGWWLALGHLITAVGARHHHHRPALRLGASQARRPGALADRQGHRAARDDGGLSAQARHDLMPTFTSRRRCGSRQFRSVSNAVPRVISRR